VSAPPCAQPILPPVGPLYDSTTAHDTVTWYAYELELTAMGQEHLRRIPFIHEDDIIVTYLRRLPDDERAALLGHLRNLVATIHGNDKAVRRITEAVKEHFAFGEQQREVRLQL
jgi:hypothetical protein